MSEFIDRCQRVIDLRKLSYATASITNSQGAGSRPGSPAKGRVVARSSEQNIANARLVVKLDMSKDPELEFDYDIVVMGGERGRQLAAAQAESILEILEWFGRPAGSSERFSPEQDDSCRRVE